MEVSNNMKLIGAAVAGAVAVFALLAFAGKVRAADKGGGGIFSDAPLAPAKSWTGIYVGGNIGYGLAVLDLPGSPDLAFKDWTFGGTIGVDGQLGKHWVIGAFANYDVLKSGDFDKGIWTLGARAGYLMTQHTLLYGLGGYSQSIDISDLNALVLGGGLEQRLGAGWSAKLEYQHLFVNESFIPSVDVHHVRAGLNYKFN